MRINSGGFGKCYIYETLIFDFEGLAKLLHALPVIEFVERDRRKMKASLQGYYSFQKILQFFDSDFFISPKTKIVIGYHKAKVLSGA